MEQFSTRQNKVARLIQKELSEYFRKEANSIFGNRLITVTVVRVTKDLSLARCYLSIFPSDNIHDVVSEINTLQKSIRYNLGNIVKKQIRVIPELEFYVDDSLDYVNNIDNLLK